MDTTVGVFLCTGCGIDEAMDCEALKKVAESEYKVKCFHSHKKLCNPDGVELIKKEISEQGLNRVVIAACSPRVKTEVFHFDSPEVFQDRLGLRELVAWTGEPKHEDTDMLAQDYIRMSIVKVQKGAPPEPFKEEISKDMLVVGGGWTGMHSALDLASAGYKVHLVEKDDKLGGNALNLAKRVPMNPPRREPEEPDIEDLIGKVQADANIDVHLATEIQRINGQPGLLDTDLKSGSEEKHVRVGAIVSAVGYRPYDPAKLAHLGYGTSPDVITNVDMEKMLKQDSLKKPSDNGSVKKVVFIQCAGSRDPDHLPYCSGVCCAETLKQARMLRDADKDIKAFILYRDMRTPGLLEDFYKSAQDDPGIFLTKADVKEVKSEGNNLVVAAENTLLGQDLELEADIVVLATGMVPNTLDNEVLKLNYRQGPDMPVDRYGFPDSNYVCFPYETQRTAMYAAGPVRQPMDAYQSRVDASGAALKAIQAVEEISRGAAVHPRAGDLTFPEFFLQRCTQCKRCTEECPFGALNEDEKGTPQPNPNRCRRCGVCMGACPERIISFKNYHVDQIVSMIKAVEIPEEDEEKPRALCLICENDAYPSLDIAALNKQKLNPYMRFLPVRCLGSVNVVFIADALSAGYDGVLLLGCKHGDDYQCHFIKGSELATKRMENVQEALQRLVLESERVRIEELALSEWRRIPKIVDEFMETLEEVGPNPYKDM
ncbi:MAG: hydrogenase iron-sulfur subunit [Deltaproteobacteria bacterium]|nr:hydrogenase iron-sulfur subunit [Deltaproteobacteria bacterium]